MMALQHTKMAIIALQFLTLVAGQKTCSIGDNVK